MKYDESNFYSFESIEIREYRGNGPEANLIEGNIYSEGTDSLRRQ